MTPKEMANEALAAVQNDQRLTLVRQKGVKMPPKFPKGELLCENHDGTRCYSYDPMHVLVWLAVHGLVKVEAKLKEKTHERA